MLDHNVDVLVKIVLIGDSGVGKSNLVHRFIHGTFSEGIANTIGVDFLIKDMVVRNQAVRVQFWDTAGQEKYRSIANAYYKNAQGAVIVYDVATRESFENVGRWLQEVNEFGEKGIQILVLGNKIDLEGKRQVLTAEAAKMAENKGAFFCEASAKTNQDNSVVVAFERLIAEIMNRIEIEERSVSGENVSLTRLEKDRGDEKSGFDKCCS
jgi:small GTP-binding protein